ncbi:uncharacterized protein BXZ73DRAFT_87170 [Epithele typhae]|uniref:uncharacterized protein n=1 Tax=Epithele typhae TaxID=378194 RepID=UPI0020073B16|nr:uncharacterized protein BXZ73DRAFT_87170 [Epithele typhae]KAH9944230.1 hypothetical protein BXZ73DRAFT_87170 [Epithele typhae]
MALKALDQRVASASPAPPRSSNGTARLQAGPSTRMHHAASSSKDEARKRWSPIREPSSRSTSSTQKLDLFNNLENMDPDELFARHTISEVKLVQQRLRADADGKQEELRLMVGERYRDLLEASTSILALAKSSKHVLQALDGMRETVHSINPARTPKRAVTGEGESRMLLGMLQNLKLLQTNIAGTPVSVCPRQTPPGRSRAPVALMEKKAYLNAAWLLLLARVVHRALSQEDEDVAWQTYGIDVMEQMPLVQRQWDSITPFRSQISHRATLSLREASSSPGEVCATLLTLHVLESRPLPETLSIYLAQRMKTLATLLTRNASTSHASARSVVRETRQKTENVLSLIALTIATARVVFSYGRAESPSLMQQALHFFQASSDSSPSLPPELQLSTQILLASLPSSSHLLLLPPSIRAFKPYIDGTAVGTSALQPHLEDKLESWFKKALQDTRIWDVRTSLQIWLKAAEDLESSERSEIRTMVDSTSQHQAAAVWKEALASIERSFQVSVKDTMDALDQHADEHQFDTQPVEHLFQAPSIPSVLQTSAHGASASAQFAKYKSSLQQQLSGRTPLLHSALTTLESHATALHEDLSFMLQSDQADHDLISRLSTSYQQDAEALSESVCRMLDANAEVDDSSCKHAIFLARICQELGGPSEFFSRTGCSSSAAECDDSSTSRPSPYLTQALLSLAAEMHILRRFQASTTLGCFIDLLLGRLEYTSGSGAAQQLWDLVFLRALSGLWGLDGAKSSEEIASRISRQTEVSSRLESSVQEYLAKTQILLSELLPTHVGEGERTTTNKTGKASALLLLGTPSVEQRFEPALELVKTPPRFGLLLVGGAPVR